MSVSGLWNSISGSSGGHLLTRATVGGLAVAAICTAPGCSSPEKELSRGIEQWESNDPAAKETFDGLISKWPESEQSWVARDYLACGAAMAREEQTGETDFWEKYVAVFPSGVCAEGAERSIRLKTERDWKDALTGIPSHVEGLPCRIEEWDDDGRIRSWWTFNYEDGRPTSAHFIGGSALAIHGSDLVKNETDNMKSGNWNRKFTYDKRGNLLAIKDGDGSIVTSFTYSRSGQISKMTGQSGTTQLDSGTPSGMPKHGLTLIGGVRIITGYTYPDAGPSVPQPLIWGNGEVYFGQVTDATIAGSSKVVMKYTVDSRNRVVSGTSSRGSSLHFRYGEKCDIGHPPM